MDFGATFDGSSIVVNLLQDMGFRVTTSTKETEAWWSKQYDTSASQEISDYTDRTYEDPYILQGTLINIGAGGVAEEYTENYQIMALLEFRNNTVMESVPREVNYLWALGKYYLTTDNETHKAIITTFVENKELADAWNALLTELRGSTT